MRGEMEINSMFGDPNSYLADEMDFSDEELSLVVGTLVEEENEDPDAVVEFTELRCSECDGTYTLEESVPDDRLFRACFFCLDKV